MFFIDQPHRHSPDNSFKLSTRVGQSVHDHQQTIVYIDSIENEFRSTSTDTHLLSSSIGSQQRYAIVVKTSDIFGAETETNVYIRIKGEHRWCDAPIALDTSLVNKKKFRRNQLDLFMVDEQSEELGALVELEVSHDESGHFPVWHLGWIAIYDLALRQLYIFKCNQWVGRTSFRGLSHITLECRSPIDIDFC